MVPKSYMGFIRVKKISGKEYAYLVENKWYKRGFKGKGSGSRQKVSRYLGRVYYFNKAEGWDFLTFKSINNLEQYLKNNSNNNFTVKRFNQILKIRLCRSTFRTNSTCNVSVR